MASRTLLSTWYSLLLAVTFAAVSAVPAGAQEVDYGAMQQLFGEPVTTSATGKPQRASDVPANMEIITQDDIRRSGATSIPDVLQYVAGVDVRRYGMADQEVGIRGYNQPYNSRLLVLVNGWQVYSDEYGHVSWPTIPVQLEEIRQIEIIKGPNSALYGFNAVDGVINIITYDPLHDKVNSATLRGGTQDYGGGSLVGTGQIGDNVGVRLSAGGFRARDFASDGLSQDDASSRDLSPQVGTFNIDARAHVAPGIEIFIDANMGDSRFAEKSFAAAFDTDFIRTNGVRAGINADTPIGLLSLSVSRNQQLTTVDQAGIGGLANWTDQELYVLQAGDLVKIGADHTVRVGLEYRNNADTGPGLFRGTIGYQIYAASLMWDWTISPNVSLTNAIRVDDLDLSYTGAVAAGSGFSNASYNGAGFVVPSFNSGLVYKVTDSDTLRFMVARGVQVPSLIDFGLQLGSGQFGPVVIAGNPDLHPSTVDNVEIDYDRVLPAIASTLRTAVFVQQTRDIISGALGVPFIIGPAGNPLLLASNVGSSSAAGVEIGLKGQSPSGFRWNASYAFVLTTNGTALNQNSVITSPIDFANSVPRHVVTAGIGYTWEKVELDLMGRWQSSYLDYETSAAPFFLTPVEINNYVTFNARVGYRLTEHITLAVTAQQFNQSRILQDAGPLVDRLILASITVHF
jgi:outer membrane receptor for ferrienterochelin and colicins